MATPSSSTLQVKPTGPIAQPNAPLAIAGALSAAGSQLKVDGQLRDPATVTGLAVDIAVDSEDPRPLLAMAGRPVSDALPPLKLAAHLSREAGPVDLRITQASWGDSSLDGQLRLDTTAPRPSLSGELHATLLDLVTLAPIMNSDDGGAPAAEAKPSGGNPLAALAGYDGELRLVLDEVRLPPRPVLKQSEATLKLADGKLTIAPLRIGLPKGSIEGDLTTGPLSAPDLTVDAHLQANGAGIAGIAGDGYGGQVDGTLAGTLLVGPLQAMLARSHLRFEGARPGRARSRRPNSARSRSTAELENGHLRLEPFHATLPQGEIAGRVAAGPFDQNFTAELRSRREGRRPGRGARTNRTWRVA